MDATRKSLILAAVLLYALLGLSVANAADPVPIGTILADPDPYQLRPVTVQGRARGLNVLPPHLSLCGIAFGAYTFKLDDGTGSIAAEAAGNCRDPNASAPFANDDPIVVEGTVKVLLDKEGDDRIIVTVGTVKKAGN